MSAVRARRRLRPGVPASVGVPVLVAVLAAIGAATVPPALVHGDVATGPTGLASLAPAHLDYRPTLQWGPRRASVVLTVHPRGRCSIRLGHVSSTAPGRIEVRVVETGGPCTGTPEAPARYRLPLPIVAEPRGSVQVELDGTSVFIHRGSPKAPHPENAHDWY